MYFENLIVNENTLTHSGIQNTINEIKDKVIMLENDYMSNLI